MDVEPLGLWAKNPRVDFCIFCTRHFYFLVIGFESWLIFKCFSTFQKHFYKISQIGPKAPFEFQKLFLTFQKPCQTGHTPILDGF